MNTAFEWGRDPEQFRRLPINDKAEMTAFLQVKAAGESYYMELSDEKFNNARKGMGKKGKRDPKYPKHGRE